MCLCARVFVLRVCSPSRLYTDMHLLPRLEQRQLPLPFTPSRHKPGMKHLSPQCKSIRSKFLHQEPPGHSTAPRGDSDLAEDPGRVLNTTPEGKLGEGPGPSVATPCLLAQDKVKELIAHRGSVGGVMVVQPEHGKGAGDGTGLLSTEAEWMEGEKPKPLCFRPAVGAAGPQPRCYSPRSRPAVSTADSSAAGGQHRAQLPLPPRRCAPAPATPRQLPRFPRDAPSKTTSILPHPGH